MNIKDLEKRLDNRMRCEKRFKRFGGLAVAVALMFIVFLFGAIFIRGYSAFQQTYIALDIHIENNDNYQGMVKKSIRSLFPEVTERREKKRLIQLVSMNAGFILKDYLDDHPLEFKHQTITVWLPTSDDVDMYYKGYIDREAPEHERRIKNIQLGWLDQLELQNRIDKKFNTIFFTYGDSRSPETAGIKGAIVGSFLTILVTLILSFPIGVATALYLEEFAPRNKWYDIVEVNINNLAAVPSIVFGLLGLAVFLNFFGLPRSAPLVGGMVLTLMTLPTIIISSRAAIKSVPPSIKDAALGMGATKMQVTFHHTLPLALPGMLTGTIIGMAQALGETAPLLMIGMVAFIVDIPQGILDPATALPVQIFLWADSPERAFVEKTAAAIMVLLGFLIIMNLLAILLRKKFERKW